MRVRWGFDQRGPGVDADRLKQLFVSRHSCVRIVTGEESEAVSLALDAARALGLDAWGWSATQGVRRLLFEDEAPIPDTANAAAGLYWLSRNLAQPSMVVTLDLAPELENTVNLRAFRDLHEGLRAGRIGAGVDSGTGRPMRSVIAMIDHEERAPSVVEASSARYRISAPDDEEIRDLVRSTLRSIDREGAPKLEIRVTGSESAFLESVVQNMRGLTRRQVRQLVADMAAGDRAVTDEDLEQLQRGKREMFQNAGVLEFVEAPTSMEAIGGLGRLKAWLAERERSFGKRAAAFGLAPPRGVLLLGVQGAGKSLASKAIATAWRRPLMRLDPGALFDKYIGETERKLREALAQAEAMAPVVLWIDEIEKGFAGSASASTDGGVGRRMFGTLLTWMQEHAAPVFLVATANDIEALPPELLRKGRFDEIFFVDLPGREARRAIFAIHLAARRQDASDFDLGALSDATEGYSGAEIEQAVLSAAHAAFAKGTGVTTASVVAAARASPPLSVTMRESIAWLREWSKGRCVAAE